MPATTADPSAVFSRFYLDIKPRFYLRAGKIHLPVHKTLELFDPIEDSFQQHAGWLSGNGSHFYFLKLSFQRALLPLYNRIRLFSTTVLSEDPEIKFVVFPTVGN